MSSSNFNVFNLSRPKSEQIMADIGSALDRLSRTYGATIGERYTDDTTGGFIAIMEWIPSPTSNGEESAWHLKRAGLGRGRTKKAAKKIAVEDLYNQLPAPGPNNTNVADWVNFLTRVCHDRVVLRGESMGSTLPQMWKFTVHVNDKEQPSGTSAWLRRKSAIYIAVKRACHEMGLVNGPVPTQPPFVIDISDNEDSGEEERSVERKESGKVHVPPPSEYSPYGNDYAGMFRFLSSRYNTVTFNAESRGSSLNSMWKYDLFIDGGTVPTASSDWATRKTARLQTLQRAYQVLGHDLLTCSGHGGDIPAPSDVGHGSDNTAPIASSVNVKIEDVEIDDSDYISALTRARSASPNVPPHHESATGMITGKRGRSASPTIPASSKKARTSDYR